MSQETRGCMAPEIFHRFTFVVYIFTNTTEKVISASMDISIGTFQVVSQILLYPIYKAVLKGSILSLHSCIFCIGHFG